jgi:DNA helicase-2/ATP-dependent DNA helicase PcrA
MQDHGSGHPLLDGLNEAQREAVLHPEGPLLIFAGAGSGKTRVLTHRIAFLMAERGVPAHRVFAATFTNKAANEMRERTERLIGRSCRGMWIGTFHSCCARMLRESGEASGVPPQFVVFDDADQMSVVRECMRNLNIDEERFAPRAILAAISRAKERLVSPQQYAAAHSGYFEDVCARVYTAYQDQLRSSGALDFDDLLMCAVLMLQNNPDVLAAYQTRFDHILVDEYQDINYAQFVLVELLAAGHRNVCVVGDDDQSIYAFRGAQVDLILRFERDYPDARVIKLERNYRSTQQILDAAHRVVSHNRTRKPKRLWTDVKQGLPIEVQETANEQEEAVFIAHRLQTLVRAGCSYGDAAVLYRTNAQSRAIEEVFANFRIPYRLVGARPFYERKEVKDIVAYLRLAHNPGDSVSLKRVINVPTRGIGATSVAHLEEQSRAAKRSLWETINDPAALQGLAPRSASAVRNFAALVSDLAAMAATSSVSELTKAVIALTDYQHYVDGKSAADQRDRMENVNELLTVTERFDAMDEEDRSLARFLEQVALVSDLDDDSAGRSAVSLMTLHASKGLEFETVFLTGMEQGVFPHSRSAGDEREMEEERRLCYVGITRAKRRLIATYAYRRSLFGMTTNNPPSQFLREMGVLKERQAPMRPVPAPPLPQTEWARRATDAPARLERVADGLKPGDKVSHATFGTGIVLSIKNDSDDPEVAVAFPQRGTVRLLRSYLKPIKRDGDAR